MYFFAPLVLLFAVNWFLLSAWLKTSEMAHNKRNQFSKTFAVYKIKEARLILQSGIYRYILQILGKARPSFFTTANDIALIPLELIKPVRKAREAGNLYEAENELLYWFRLCLNYDMRS